MTQITQMKKATRKKAVVPRAINHSLLDPLISAKSATSVDHTDKRQEEEGSRG